MKRVALIPGLALLFTVVPTPRAVLGPPEVLSHVEVVGSLRGPGEVQEAPFAIEYLGISWISGEAPRVRFLRDGRWTGWKIPDDESFAPRRRGFSTLVAGRGAERFQLRGRAAGVRTMAINTTDGPRPVRWAANPPAEASHLDFPGVVSRRGWGADESKRFRRGRPRGSTSFVPVRKLIIHHTVTPRWDPGPAAVRAIYRYHTEFRGWGDIAYHYLISADGRVFKGRYSGPPGTRVRDRVAPDRGRGQGVSGAHTLGANAGTIGIALLGNYNRSPLSPAAREALVRLLGWLSDRYGIDPRGTSAYRGAWGTVTTKNIAGHRAYGPTECPGDAVARDLPSIRGAVARLLSGPGAADGAHPPQITGVWTPKVGREGLVVRWTTDRPVRTVVRFRAEGRGAWRRVRPPGWRTRHAVRLHPLRRGTSYVVRLGAQDGRGNWRWSAPHLLRTRR